jgi:molybdopterin molybdotransferase
MITVSEALRLVLERAQPGGLRRVALVDAAEKVLAEDILCTIDSPPHDKSLVDGYAVQVADSKPGAVLRVLEQVTAGQVPTLPVTAGGATRIMTGAPIPSGADAVAMVERTELIPGPPEMVRIQDKQVRTGQNIMRRGESMRKGETVLARGHVLRGIEIGLLAELGVAELSTVATPTVAVLATGDELVPFEATPSAGQIRNSNGPMLRQLAAAAGCEAVDLGIARDTEIDHARWMRRGLESDVLLLSGGVSAGVLDLVPQQLGRLGVKQVFHKVDLRPGKPLWFGVIEHSDRPNQLVFGLPGNPVSGLVCFQLFVRPALAQMSGRAAEGMRQSTAVLAATTPPRSDRPTYFPGRATQRNGDWIVEPLSWRGSADLRTLANANVLIFFPTGPGAVEANDRVAIYWL